MLLSRGEPAEDPAVAEATSTPAADPGPTPPEAELSASELHERALELARDGADLEPTLDAFAAALAHPGADRTQLFVDRLALLVRRRQRERALLALDQQPSFGTRSPQAPYVAWLEAEALLTPGKRPLTQDQADRLVALLEGLLDDANWSPVARARLLGLSRSVTPQALVKAYGDLESASPWGPAEQARRVLLGSYFNSTQRYAQAERLLRDAIEVHPDATEALTLLAFVLRNRHRDTSAGNQEAADLYARIVRLSLPNPPPQVLLYRARLLCEMEDFAEAAACARQRLELGDDPRASFWLSVACLELGKRGEARSAIRAANAQGEEALRFEFQILNAKLPGRAAALYDLLRE